MRSNGPGGISIELLVLRCSGCVLKWGVFGRKDLDPVDPHTHPLDHEGSKGCGGYGLPNQHVCIHHLQKWDLKASKHIFGSAWKDCYSTIQYQRPHMAHQKPGVLLANNMAFVCEHRCFSWSASGELVPTALTLREVGDLSTGQACAEIQARAEAPGSERTR